MITPRLAAGFAILALVGQVKAGPSIAAIRALRGRQWRTAAQSLRESLEQSPEDPALLARLGLAYYQLGLYSDAAAAFHDAAGSEYYERQGIGAHATTLRELGRYEELAPLRQGQILAASDEATLNNAYLGAADDAIAIGNLDMALDMAMWALALRPQSPSTQAWLADIYQRRGEPDEAGFHLWLAGLAGYDGTRASQVEARIALEDDAIVEALDAVERGRHTRRRNGQLAVVHAEIYRCMGWYSDAQAIFERQGLHFGERRDYLVERAQLLLVQGDAPEGCAMLARADELYPHHPQAAELLDGFGCADGTTQ